MGNNIFSSGMEFLAIIALIIVVAIVLLILVFPIAIQIFNEFFWLLGIGFIFLALLVGGVMIILIKQLFRLV